MYPDRQFVFVKTKRECGGLASGEWQIDFLLLHTLEVVYKEAYQIGKKVPKRDRFGLWTQVENELMACFTLAIEASLGSGSAKIPLLKKLRVKIDVAKRLIRLSQELGILDEKKYFSLQKKLIESSKMAHGWLAYFERTTRPN